MQSITFSLKFACKDEAKFWPRLYNSVQGINHTLPGEAYVHSSLTCHYILVSEIKKESKEPVHLTHDDVKR